MPAVISFHDVCKRYRLGSGSQDLGDLLAGLRQRGFGARPSQTAPQDFWALSGVSFELERGQVLGIVGDNGAGKSTILKLLSGITLPTSGTLRVEGRVSALIELGAGFDPDLTGRENVYLNATILGMSKKEIDRRFDSIVEFAEVEEFIDTPVKRYSSGMYARLGFAIAAHADTELLLVDEVLGVGDQNFQRKCYDFIHEFVRGKKSAVFVSHNLFVIEQLCDGLIWLDRGKIRLAGTPQEVLPAYFDHIDRAELDKEVTRTAGGVALRITDVRLCDRRGRKRQTFTTGEDIVAELVYEAAGPLATPHFGLGVVQPGAGALFAANMLVDGAAPSVLHGQGVVRCIFHAVPLMPRTYELWGEVWGADRASALIRWQKLGSFRIATEQDASAEPFGSGAITRLRTSAPIRVAYAWEISSTTDRSSPQGHGLNGAPSAALRR